jgi:hypothetical protein
MVLWATTGHTMRTFSALLFLAASGLSAQNTFEITVPVPGLTNVAGGQQLPDGGFVFGGELNDGLVVVRTDSTGAVLWTRALAEAANEEGLYDRSIAVSGDRIFMGGYAMGPATSSRDGILHVLDLDGIVLSQRLIDVVGGSNAVHTITGTANGALIAGRREGAGSYDMLLQQVDIDGNMTGSWGYGSSGWDWAYEAVPLNNGHMALVGYGDGVGGPAPSAYLVRTDAQGQELWARGVDGASADEAYTVMEDASNADLYMGGTTLGMGAPGTRGFITKFNADGTHQWTRVIGNAFDVIGLATIVPGRYAAVLRAQNIAGGHGNYDVLVLVFNGNGELLSNRLFGSTASEYPVAMSRSNTGGLLVTSFKSGTGGNSIHAVLTDEFGNGGCTGITVQPQWTEHTPTIFNHSSTQQTGHNLSSWITPTTQPSLTRQFVCCTYPVEASLATQPGDALAYTFTNTSTGGGTASWNIAGTAYIGDVVEHAFPAPGTYQVCLTIQGVCATDTHCEGIAVATTGMAEHADPTSFTLQPNPATDRVRITSAAPMRAVELIDATGRVVRHITGKGATALELEIASLQPGVFVLRAWTDAGSVHRRMVKQ